MTHYKFVFEGKHNLKSHQWVQVDHRQFDPVTQNRLLLVRPKDQLFRAKYEKRGGKHYIMLLDRVHSWNRRACMSLSGEFASRVIHFVNDLEKREIALNVIHGVRSFARGGWAPRTLNELRDMVPEPRGWISSRSRALHAVRAATHKDWWNGFEGAARHARQAVAFAILDSLEGELGKDDEDNMLFWASYHASMRVEKAWQDMRLADCLFS